MRRRLRLAFALLSFAAMLTPAHAAAVAPLDSYRGDIVVPIDYNPPSVPYPIVTVKINGHAPLPFLIDTGANDFVIQPWAVAALGLTPKTVTSRADGSVQQQVSELKARLEDAKNTRHLDVSVTDARVLDAPILNQAVVGTRLAGIVSFGFLAWSVFRLDLSAKTLTIFHPTDAPFSVPGAAAIPLILTTGALPVIPLSSDTINPASVILDTGTLNTQLPLAIAKILPGVRQIDYAFTERASAIYVTPEIQADEFSLGPLHVPHVIAVVLPPDVPASLGLNVLSRYRVTIDAAHHQCFFEPAPTAFVASAPSGIILTKRNGVWEIISIDPDSPAAKSGLVKGDSVITVDGHDVNDSAKHTVQTLLYGLVGTTAHLTVQRVSGAVQNITFVRSVFTPSRRSPLTGLMLKVIQGGPLNVLDVSESCPASTVGLRADDKITTINGKSVSSLDFGQIADVLDAPKLSLTITRKAVSEPITMDISETSVK